MIFFPLILSQVVFINNTRVDEEDEEVLMVDPVDDSFNGIEIVVPSAGVCLK